MNIMKNILIWYFYTATYAIILTLLFIIIPEDALYSIIYGAHVETDAVAWDNIHITILLISAVFLNSLVICFFSRLTFARFK
ncbi:hypothetical protein AGJ35_05350 [Cronobacter dublinensis subsp. dublinensis]|nr:hypothetical protein [Cronobacter dublinensis subsp. dublinensis]EGT5736887.1 hypothetical protein [Cronobacter dublinensis subsp. dublinensis]